MDASRPEIIEVTMFKIDRASNPIITPSPQLGFDKIFRNAIQIRNWTTVGLSWL